MNRITTSTAAFVLGFAILGTAGAQTDISKTRHNLTATGPGTLITTQPAGICVFCHTPHNANPTRALWNRSLPGQTYKLYGSSTTVAVLNQPTGSSRLCLSCHDGVLAVGNLRNPPKGSNIVIGAITGTASLGQDLSDDHPVSFVYDSTLALTRGQLVDPSGLPPTVRLDDTRQMQCTSCHDPHEDRQPNFLRTETRYGALCTACHRPNHWTGSAHATSTAGLTGAGTNPWPVGGFGTVAENACESCHRPHAAGHGQRLLAQPDETTNCTVCHGGTVAPKNIAQEFAKPFRHDVASTPWVHDPAENPAAMTRHVACADCHNPHAATANASVPPAAPGALAGVKGLSLGGSVVPEATYEYEVCSKCHGLTEPLTAGLIRQSGTRNVRLKIDLANQSFHPVAGAGKNPAILGLQPGYTPASLINCTSCHNNDDWTAAGVAPRGPHGSRYQPILAAQYLAVDPTPESYASYALCYQCHNESYVANDLARTFPHNRHVVLDQAPCAACHDAHGSRNNAHLIDFLLRDRNGGVVVTPSAAQGRLEYTTLGAGHGQCYLQCHGVNHEPKAY